MMNNLTLLGRWVKDLELRYTPQGKCVATGTLAVQRDFKNAQGEYDADFPNIVVWGASAETLANRSGKGLLTGITGRLQTRSYENQEGKKVYVTEVVATSVRIVEWKDNGQGGQNRPSGQSGNNPNRNPMKNPSQPGYPEGDPFANVGQPIEISDDDLPF